MNATKMIGILGGGESGIGAALLAKQKGYQVLLSDAGKINSERKEELNQYQVNFEESGHTFEKLKHADLIVKSPGIPDTAHIVRQLEEENIEVISEIEFAYLHQKGKIIAITGSNGKTTTTHLVYHFLQFAGFDVAEVGNVGKSFARQVFEKPCAWYVIEVSSFQLDGIRTFRPDISILLNITPDHLNRYNGEIDQYAASKFRICLNQERTDQFIYNAMDEGITSRISDVEIKAVMIPLDQRFFVGDKKIQIENEQSFSTDEANLIGRHNQINLLAATIAAKEAGVLFEQIKKSLPSFKNDPHRLEIIGEWNHVQYINDSKATNVDAVFYALDAMEKPVIWIAGGEDKGNNYKILQELVRQKVKALICLGMDNRKINEAFSTTVLDYKETTQVLEAVQWAASIAQPGDVVLLSPACASFDLFKNYKHRGNMFKEAVINWNERKIN
jgi:UDP-N-acetylmuramoylalanine--D-glutamate ligase